MSELAAILWLGLLVGLGGLFVMTLRRMSALTARTRDLERFQSAVDSIDRRFAGAVDPLVRALDEMRRHAGDPAALRAQAAATETVIEELSGEARALADHGPAVLAGAVAAMTAELERAQRAASLVDHGLGALANTSIGRDLEAQTSLKRGALNLRHSRDAFALRAREVAALEPADVAPGPPSRGVLAASSEAPAAPDGEDAST